MRQILLFVALMFPAVSARALTYTAEVSAGSWTVVNIAASSSAATDVCTPALVTRQSAEVCNESTSNLRCGPDSTYVSTTTPEGKLLRPTACWVFQLGPKDPNGNTLKIQCQTESTSATSATSCVQASWGLK